MSLELRIIEPTEIEEILDFEMRKLIDTIPDETTRTFQVWNSRWRKEALEHYLKLGWSFLARDNGKLVGYFLAQPMLFLEGQTQSLWIEHIQFSSLEVRDALCDLGYRLSREKHFQRVYFPNSGSIGNAIKSFSPTDWQPAVSLVKTTRT